MKIFQSKYGNSGNEIGDKNLIAILAYEAVNKVIGKFQLSVHGMM
jgi:hypothetical protein